MFHHPNNSQNRHPDFMKLKPRQGYSLIEVMIALALSVIVIGSLMATTIFVLRSFKAIGNYTDLDRTSRFALDLMSRDIRNAAGMSMATFKTNNITLTNADGSSFSYQWDPTATTLKRYFTNSASAGGAKSVTTLLTNCDILSFYLYYRVPDGNGNFPATNNPSIAKLINVDWRCSRKIYGNKMNTESIQTAQITIRN